MSFVAQIYTAFRLRRLKNILEQEKQDGVKLAYNMEPPRRIRHFFVDIIYHTRLFFSKLGFPKNSPPYKFCYNLKHSGTIQNYYLKSLFGFLAGLIITYFFFLFCIIQLHFQLTTATIFCSILGTVLTIGLAFSTRIRCIVLLTLPQFFSKKGREALMAYAFILAISGPATNTLNNLEILSESLSCGQEQLKSALQQILEMIKKPFAVLKEAIKKVVEVVKKIVNKIKEILMKIKRLIVSLVKVIQGAFDFISKLIRVCNKELGTPFQRCTRIFETAILDCNAKLGPSFSWLCSLTYLVESVCYMVKPFDYVCIKSTTNDESLTSKVMKKVKSFVEHIKTMFYVRIKFHHSYDFKSNASKTISEVADAMVKEVKSRTIMLRTIFEFMTSASALFFMFLIFQVAYYRYRFMTSERFDNKYITKDFILIDLQRAKMARETLLPLSAKERSKYISISSRKLLKSERAAVYRATLQVFTAAVKLSIYMGADYSLFWLMTKICYYGKFQSKKLKPNMPIAIIAGEGLLADLLKCIVKAFQPLGLKLEIDTAPCLPIPIPPDYDKYVQIVFLLILCLVLTVLQPYGLRFRNWIMCYYYPQRSKERTIWLYNNIMRSRTSFLKFARRQLRRKFLGDDKIEKMTFVEFLGARLKHPIFRTCFPDKQQVCLLCAVVLREDLVKCSTPGCLGIYCSRCFGDLQNLCTVCLSPIEYGDFSDISEEVDSSEVITPRKIEDSDNETNVSTDLEYDYQEEEASFEAIPSRVPSGDVERQAVKDYASMESFREIEEDLEEKPVYSRKSSGRISLYRKQLEESRRLLDSSSEEEEFKASRNDSLRKFNVNFEISSETAPKPKKKRGVKRFFKRFFGKRKDEEELELEKLSYKEGLDSLSLSSTNSSFVYPRDIQDTESLESLDDFEDIADRVRGGLDKELLEKYCLTPEDLKPTKELTETKTQMKQKEDEGVEAKRDKIQFSGNPYMECSDKDFFSGTTASKLFSGVKKRSYSSERKIKGNKKLFSGFVYQRSEGYEKLLQEFKERTGGKITKDEKQVFGLLRKVKSYENIYKGINIEKEEGEKKKRQWEFDFKLGKWIKNKY